MFELPGLSIATPGNFVRKIDAAQIRSSTSRADGPDKLRPPREGISLPHADRRPGGPLQPVMALPPRGSTTSSADGARAVPRAPRSGAGKGTLREPSTRQLIYIAGQP